MFLLLYELHKLELDTQQGPGTQNQIFCGVNLVVNYL